VGRIWGGKRRREKSRQATAYLFQFYGTHFTAEMSDAKLLCDDCIGDMAEA
jgi:hypothetical protein